MGPNRLWWQLLAARRLFAGYSEAGPRGARMGWRGRGLKPERNAARQRWRLVLRATQIRTVCMRAVFGIGCHTSILLAQPGGAISASVGVARPVPMNHSNTVPSASLMRKAEHHRHAIPCGTCSRVTAFAG